MISALNNETLPFRIRNWNSSEVKLEFFCKALRVYAPFFTPETQDMTPSQCQKDGNKNNVIRLKSFCVNYDGKNINAATEDGQRVLSRNLL